jgi:hypothetical protein
MNLHYFWNMKQDLFLPHYDVLHLFSITLLFESYPTHNLMKYSLSALQKVKINFFKCHTGIFYQAIGNRMI